MDSANRPPELRSIGFPLLDIVAFAVMLAVNLLVMIAPPYGVSVGDIAARFPALFMPASYAFGIWGLIYLLLLLCVVYAVLPAQRMNRRLDGLESTFVWSCVFNVGWLVAWYVGIMWLSEIAMLGLLVTLIALYRQLNRTPSPRPAVERWTVDLPFSIYLGWVCVAFVLNTVVLLMDLGADLVTIEPYLTLVLVAVVLILGFVMLFRQRDAAFALTLVWGLVGIAIARYGDSTPVFIASLAAAVLLLLTVVVLPGPSREATTPAQTPIAGT